MQDDLNIRNAQTEQALEKVRKPGRPRAIPLKLEPFVAELHKQDYGYRTIARILINDYNINLHFSTVKRLLKLRGILSNQGSLPNCHSNNPDVSQ